MAGVLLGVNASNPLPPGEAPSAEQGLLSLGLMGGGFSLALAPELVGAGATAACGDGECTNEANQVVNQISKFQPSDAKAVAQFANEAPVVQAQRRFDSFGQVWNNVSSDPNAVNDLFIHRTGERVTGMMEVVSRQNSNALEVKLLEGWGGAGTKLMQTAVQESINRGFDGRLILHAKDQAMKFYQDLGGKLIDPARNLFSFDEKAAQEILKLNP